MWYNLMTYDGSEEFAQAEAAGFELKYSPADKQRAYQIKALGYGWAT
jgi:hypothetical protein